MTDTEWKPVRVTRLEREMSHEQAREKTLDTDLRDCRARIQGIKAEIEQEMKHGTPDADAAV